MLYDYNEGCLARGESELSYDTSGFVWIIICYYQVKIGKLYKN